MTNPIVRIENFDIQKELACRCCDLFSYDDEFLIRLQAFRYMFNKPLTVTGGCRCIKHNKEVGGVPNSNHLCEGYKASAIDVSCDNIAKLYVDACESNLFNEVIMYRSKKFVHLAFDKRKKQVFYQIKN